MPDLYRISLKNSESWHKTEQSNQSDKDKAESLGDTLKLFEYKTRQHTYYIPSDSATLEQFLTGGTILVYQFGKWLMNCIGYRLFLNTDGSRAFSGMRVCKEKKPENMPGLTFPSDYRVLSPISVLSDESNSLGIRQELILASLYLVCSKKFKGSELNKRDMGDITGGKYFDDAQELINATRFTPKERVFDDGTVMTKEEEEADKEYQELKRLAFRYSWARKKFVSIWEDFNLSNQKNQAISNILSEGVIPHEEEKIDINGTGGCTKYIPKKEWFSDKIRENVSLELLSVFPEAERNVFAMFLGRVVAGRQGQVYADGTRNKIGWRGMPVLIDSKGGMGKSQFTGMMIEALRTLGYTYGSFPPSMSGNFGFGDAARSDLFNIDDATDETLPGIIQSAILKSLISNSDNISVHDKGQKHTIVRFPKCAGFVIANSFPLHKMNLDGGMISRILPMKLWNDEDVAADQFKEKFDVRFPLNDVMSDMAKRLNTTVHVIIMYLLRLCLDIWQGFESTDDLIAKLQEETAKFRLNLKTDHHKEMMNKYLLVKKRLGLTVNHFEAGDFLKMMCFISSNYYDPKSSVPYPWSQGINQLATTPNQILGTLNNLVSQRISVKRVFAEFMESLTSTNGSNYSKHINFWSNLFYDCLTKVDKLSDPLDDEMYLNPHLRADKQRRKDKDRKEDGLEPKPLEWDLRKEVLMESTLQIINQDVYTALNNILPTL